MKAAALFWCAASVVAFCFFVAWNDPLRYAAQRFVPLLLAAGFMAACAGFGAFTRVRDPIASTAIGMGIAGAIIFAAGLLHAFSMTFFRVLIVAGLLLFAVRLWRAWLTKPIDATTDPADPLAAAIISGIFIVLTPFVLAPEVSVDALEYHLLIPKLHLINNTVSSFPLFMQSHYPLLAEHLYTLLLGLGDDIAAKSFHFLCAVLVMLVLARNGKRLAAALFIMMPVACLTAGWAWNDMLFTLFVLLSMEAIVERKYVQAGVLFGLASWTKYTFVLACTGIAAMFIRDWICAVRAKEEGRSVIRDWFRFAIPVLAIAAIWMTRNAIETGNPFYPFVNGIFKAREFTATMEAYFHGALTHYEIPQWHWWTWLTFPFLLTLTPRLIDIHPGPVMLLLLPLAFRRAAGNTPIEDRRIDMLRAYAIGITVGWLFIRTEERSLLTLFAVLAVLIAHGFSTLSPSMKRAGRVVIAAGFAANVVLILVSAHVLTAPLRYFVGLESRSDYVVRMDPKQGAYRWLSGQRDVGRILLVGLHDPFYSRRPVLFSSGYDTPIAEVIVRRAVTAERIANDLKGAGVTHIAFRSSQFERNEREHLYDWTSAEHDTFLAFLRERCRVVARSGDVIVFQLL